MLQGCSLGATLHGGALLGAPEPRVGAAAGVELGAQAHAVRDLALGVSTRAQYLRTPAGADLFVLRTAFLVGYARLPAPYGSPVGAEVLARLEVESTETGFGFLPGLTLALPVRLERRAAPGESQNVASASWALVPGAQVSVPVLPAGLVQGRGVEVTVSVGLRLHLTSALWP
jgi:hypothetical protein